VARARDVVPNTAAERQAHLSPVAGADANDVVPAIDGQRFDQRGDNHERCAHHGRGVRVFVSTGVPSINEIGLGCAVAIAVDATVVRLVLVPAAMELLRRWNWWVPAPLERLLAPTGLEEAVA
jgi:hypothetical protein